MNYIATGTQPFMALVDDDAYSARLLTRMLLAHGSPNVVWHDSSAAATTALAAILAHPGKPRPDLVIVDVKASSVATRDFVSGLRKLDGAERLLVVAMAPSLEREAREALLDAGADAVFQRHAEIDAYRREAANIVSYWVRNRHLEAIGQ